MVMMMMMMSQMRNDKDHRTVNNEIEFTITLVPEAESAQLAPEVKYTMNDKLEHILRG